MNKSIIVSDVGGTNGRFAIAEYSDMDQKPQLHSIQVLSCKKYPSFSDMLADYLDQITIDIPQIARFAVAGEMTSKQGNLWHFNWDIQARDLKKRFGFRRVKLMNDYEALVKVIPYLTDADLLTLTPFKKGLKKAPYSVFGVGSGFGAAIGIPRKSGPKVVSTEIGHTSFAPKTDLEKDLLNYLSKNMDHISIETLLSGPGIVRLHHYIMQRDNIITEEKTAPEITLSAEQKTDDQCVKTVNLFLSILASVAGDIAIAQGARAGLYIGGGIIPKITNMINADSFLEKFNDKGPMRPYAEKIPVHIITADMPALLGAAILKRKDKDTEDFS